MSAAAGFMLPSFDVLGGFSADDLVEVAPFAASRVLLKKQRKVVFVELLEPLIPGNVFETGFAAIAREIDSQNADVPAAPGVPYTGWFAAALFGPATNFFMIFRCLRKRTCHSSPFAQTGAIRLPNCTQSLSGVFRRIPAQKLSPREGVPQAAKPPVRWCRWSVKGSQE